MKINAELYVLYIKSRLYDWDISLFPYSLSYPKKTQMHF